MLEGFLAGQVFGLLLVFARIGSALMVLPGIGDGYVPPRIRLILAMLLAVLIMPVLPDPLPPAPASPLALLALMFGEVVIGLFLGLIARVLLAAVDVAGVIISFNLSLSSAAIFNPLMAVQGSMISAFMTVTAVMLLLVTDLHHLMISAVVDSYALFPVGVMPPFGDLADVFSHVVARSFLIGVQVAAPFIALGVVFNIGLGLISRLMPQLQIFFIAMPAQILAGLLVLVLVLSAGMMYWLGQFDAALNEFWLQPG